MNIFHDVNLADFSTMRLGGTAAFLTEVHSRNEVVEALDWATQQRLPCIMIGSGSNIIWQDTGFQGLVLVNKIQRYEVFEEDATNVYVTVGAGERWDSVVERTVADGLTGIEALSLIPGTAGATPVQNVGAYGQEISQTLATVEAFDNEHKALMNMPVMDCAFGYRTSRFKTTDHGRFFITALTLHLTRGNPQPPYYPSVQAYFEEHSITQVTPQALRDAVVAIRSAKLPDPELVANNGSFFANPIVDAATAGTLVETYPSLPHWPTEDGRVKLSAAWLIEQAGFKDFHDPETGMATWSRQPLVFVNEAAKSTADLLRFRQKILDAVQAKFNIPLQQEPELLPQQKT